MKKILSILLLSAMGLMGLHAQPKYVGRFFGDGLGLSNLFAIGATNLYGYGFDVDAEIYCRNHGVTNLASIWKVSNFMRELRLGQGCSVPPIYSYGESLFLRSNLNNANLTNSTTWRGKAVSIYGSSAPTYDLQGVTYGYGLNQALWLTNLIDLRTNTTFVVASITYSNWAVGSHGVFVMQNSGRTDSFTGSHYGLYVDQNLGIDWRVYDGGGTANSFGYQRDYDMSVNIGSSYVLASEYPRTYVSSISNTTFRGWLENIPAGKNGSVYTRTPNLELSGTVAAYNSPLTNWIVGGYIINPFNPFFQSYPSTISVIVAFTNALDQAQVECVNRALKWLDPHDEIVLFYGASLTASKSFDAAGDIGDQRKSFTWQMMNRLNVNPAFRWINFSVPGINIDQQNDNTNFLRSVAFWAPDGMKYRRGTCYVGPSCYNQFYAGSTVAETFSKLTNLCARIQSFGFRVKVFTEPPIATLNYSTNASGASWTNFSFAMTSMIVSNSALFDSVLRYDLVFSSDYEWTTNSGNFTDGIHLSPKGNFAWSQSTKKQTGGQSGGFDNFRSYYTNVTLVGATSLVVNFVPFDDYTTNYIISAPNDLVGATATAKSPTNFTLGFSAATLTAQTIEGAITRIRSR